MITTGCFISGLPRDVTISELQSYLTKFPVTSVIRTHRGEQSSDAVVELSSKGALQRLKEHSRKTPLRKLFPTCVKFNLDESKQTSGKEEKKKTRTGGEGEIKKNNTTVETEDGKSVEVGRQKDERKNTKGEREEMKNTKKKNIEIEKDTKKKKKKKSTNLAKVAEQMNTKVGRETKKKKKKKKKKKAATPQKPSKDENEALREVNALASQFHMHLCLNPNLLQNSANREHAGQVFQQFLHIAVGNLTMNKVHLEALVMAKLREKKLLRSYGTSGKVIMVLANAAGKLPRQKNE